MASAFGGEGGGAGRKRENYDLGSHFEFVLYFRLPRVNYERNVIIVCK